MCAYVSNEHGGISEYSPTHSHRAGFEYNKYSRAVLIRSAEAARKARQRYISKLPLGDRCLKQRCCLKAAMGLRSFPPRLWISRIERRRKTASVRSRQEARGIFFSPESSRCAESRIKTESQTRIKTRRDSGRVPLVLSLSLSLSLALYRGYKCFIAQISARELKHAAYSTVCALGEEPRAILTCPIADAREPQALKRNSRRGVAHSSRLNRQVAFRDDHGGQSRGSPRAAARFA